MPHAKCNYIATTTSSQQLESRQNNIESIFCGNDMFVRHFLKRLIIFLAGLVRPMTVHFGLYKGAVVVIIIIIIIIIIGSIALTAKRRCLSYTEADFEVFRPAGVTRCTDGGEIWQNDIYRFRYMTLLPLYTEL